MASWLSPLLVVLGWIIVNIQNNHRETRKEIRASIDRIYKALEEVEKSAIQFHVTEEWDDFKAMTIQTNIGRLTRSTRITGNALGINLDEECKKFRQAVTLNNFDKSSHQAVPHDSNIINKIVTTSEQIYVALEKKFYANYLKKKN